MQSRYGPPPAEVPAEGDAAAEKKGAMAGFMQKLGFGKKDKDEQDGAAEKPAD